MSLETQIRIGFIGLSPNGFWGKFAHLPYLQSALGRKSYRIVALCNSSVEAAKSAIAAFQLDPTTKAYGSPDDLANDAEVDLVVCTVNAPLHAPTIRPSIAAAKRLFVEWPLGRSLAETKELVHAAQDAGIAQKDLVVGLEEPWEACAVKVNKICESGKIGRVLHSSLDITGVPLSGRVVKSHEYALYLENGGWTAIVAHSLYAITIALGPLANCSSRAINALPDVSIVDSNKDMEALRTIVKDVPDHIVLAGQFAANSTSLPGASFSGQIRTDARFGDEPMFTWRIMGETGQLKITLPNWPGIPEFDDSTKMEHLDNASGKITEVAWRRGSEDSEAEGMLAHLSGPARTIGRVYEAFAKGQHVGLADWDSALRLFEQVDAIVNKGEYRP